jgi:type IV pilus assembly protein PilQ
MKLTMRLQPLLTVLMFAALVAVPNINPAYAAVQQDKATVRAQATIQAVQLVGDEAAIELLITTSSPVTYTSYRSVAPARLVLDFSQTVPADGLSAEVAGKGAVKAVVVKRYDTDAGILTRMEIHLAQDIDPVVTPVAGKQHLLRVTFPGYKPAPVVASAAETATAPVSTATQSQVAAVAESAVTGITGAADTIQIEVQGTVTDFKTFRLTKPERVVVDLMGVKAAPALKIVAVNAAGISTARVGSYNDKTRIVLDAVNGGLPDAVVVKNAAGVAVSFALAANADEVKQAASVSAQPVAVETNAAAPVNSANNQIEAIDFQAFEKLSRVSVKIKGPFTVENPTKSDGFISLRVANVLLPKHLQRSYEAREFASPVLRVTPIQVRTAKGMDTIIRVAMRAEATYNLRKEADMVYLEFAHPADMAAESLARASKAAPAAQAAPADAAVEQQLVQSSSSNGKRTYVGRKVTLEFADAEVRKIFQLLSEVSNKNFVLGDEVTGAISLKLVNVPWDQALDIILDTKGLDKREEGNIILIRGKGKFKSLLDEEQEIRKAALKSEPLETRMFDVNYADLAGIVTQFTALKTDRGVITSDARTNKVIVKDVKTALDDMDMLLKNLDIPEKQVMIEARIIEASTSFTKSLGIHWGLYTDPNIGGGLGITNLETSFGGLTSTDPLTEGGFTQVPGAFTDIAFGTIGANVKLNMRLNAAATAGLVKIISTPKVATLNNKTAKITQGQQIPYTSATSDKIETKFVEAALSLEVTPHINSNGTIVLKIDAKNDAPDRQTSVGTPPINKKQATTEMLLRDGETTVIGGIYVDRDTEGSDGVPWLMDIPFIGHLFKSTNTEKSKSELLIFITPRILSMT